MEDSGRRQREVAERLGMTERTTSRVIRQLREAGYITAVRGTSRRNFYTVRLDCRLQHPLEQGRSVGHLLRLFTHAAEAGDGVERGGS